MTSEMIERVAIAIWDENQKLKGPDERRFTWAEYEEGRNQDAFRNIARAAIEAMREPTPIMMDRGRTAIDPKWAWTSSVSKSESRDCWRAMIDEALKKPA